MGSADEEGDHPALGQLVCRIGHGLDELDDEGYLQYACSR